MMISYMKIQKDNIFCSSNLGLHFFDLHNEND